MFGSIKGIFMSSDKAQIKEAISQGAFLVDVRSPAEFSSGSIKGSVNIPLDKIIPQLPKFKGKKAIVVFCRSGSRSAQAKSILEGSGFQNVINGGSWTAVNEIMNG